MSSEHEKKVEYEFLDPKSEVDIGERNLPHWFQPGKAIFITFRTFDSIPKQIADQWRNEIRKWLESKELSIDLIGPAKDDVQMRSRHARINSLKEPLKSELKKLRIKLWNDRLDECHGACLLQRNDVAKILSDAILYYDQERYDVDCFVIMPNHVHAIVQFKNGYDLSVAGTSWMQYTARQINKLLNTKGRFWQSEPFDHAIRNEKQFTYLRKYIRDNPRKAKLSPSQYTYWQRQE